MNEGNPYDFAFNEPTQKIGHMNYDTKAWASTTAEHNRLPLCTMAARFLNWEDTRHIFTANIPAIYEVDWLTGL